MSDQQHTGEASAFGDGAYQQPQPTAPVQPPLPGAVLAAERRARGWSIEYVASHLKLATRQIHALEEDRFDALPGAVVTRGFVRIYAKMLGIDSAALIAALPAGPASTREQIVPTRSLSTPFSESSLPLRGRSDFPIGRLIAAVVGVLLIAGIYGAMRLGVWTELKGSPLLQRLHMSAVASPTGAASTGGARDEEAEPPAVADRENLLPSETAPAAQPESAAIAETPPATISTPAASHVAVAATPPASATEPSPTPAAPTAPVASANPEPSPTPPPAPSVAVGPNPLQLTIRQDSWVDIRRADKSVVVSRVLKAGTTESFDIDQPVSIVIGNVGGVTATFRGRAFDLVSSYGNNVARMNLK
ncbi:MAG: hypothetical protein JWP38_48 [Herbaspirillum sp.]|nr:hypothetical protein [Herbaspirillum sp.]